MPCWLEYPRPTSTNCSVSRILWTELSRELVVVTTSRQSSQTNPCKDNLQNCDACFQNAWSKAAKMYLAELIEDYKPARELRSTSRLLLKEPCVQTTTGQRSFHFATVNIWNGLPDHIRSFASLDMFKKHLKTHLHTLSYCT